MRPVLPEGSVVHVDSNVPLNSLGPGSVITYARETRDLLTTHRVIAVERADGVTAGFRTKGDANPTPDSGIVPIAEVDGVARLVVPFAGLLACRPSGPVADSGSNFWRSSSAC